MRKCMLLLLACIALSGAAVAQIQFNPQIGVNFTRLNSDPRIIGDIVVETEGRGGILLGADLRIGDRIYLQPGAFIMASKIVYSYQDSFLVDPYEVKRFDGKLKGLVGVKIIDASAFRLRAMAGPTYNFNINTNADENPYFDEDDFKKGYFNIDAGVGIDLAFLTAELGYSFAVSEVLSNDIFEDAPRYHSIYATVGIVIGN